jgi:ABC-type oligopeptide transport system substrate-binding subunit
MKRISACLLALLLGASVVACGQPTTQPIATESAGQEKNGKVTTATNHDTGTLFINISSEPKSLDPTLNTTIDGMMLAVNTFAGLYTYDANGDIVPAIAEGEPEISEDGLTYKITMKKTKWSNGDPLMAEDFVYSWNRAILPETAVDYVSLFDVIARNEDGTLAIVATDDYTLEITLQNPCAYFMEMLAFPVFFPVHRASVEAANPAGNTPGAWTWEAGFVCNGAFQLKEWRHEESMVYEKNKNFYNADQVQLEHLEMMLNADDGVSYTAYNSGDLDFINQIPSSEMESLKANPEFHLSERLGVEFVAFNVNAPIFDGLSVEQAKKFRQAINMLIDRNYLVTNYGYKGQTIADSYVPSGMSDGNSAVFKTEYTSYFDGKKTGVAMEEEAIALLEECGYTFEEKADGTYTCSPEIHLPYIMDQGDLNRHVAESIQSDLAQVGIVMEIEEMDRNAFFERQEAGDFVFSKGTWVADFNDPINMLLQYETNCGNNVPCLGRGASMEALNWSAYDELLTQIQQESDFQHRVELMHQAEDMLMDTYAVLPLYYDNDAYLLKSNVSGIYTTQTGNVYFMYATKK